MQKIGRSLRIATVFFFLLVLFQNCSAPVSFRANQPKDTSASHESGNGSGYGGKPDGNYYHFVPDFQCEGQSTAQSQIEIAGNDVVHTEHKRNQCESKKTQLSLDDLDVSPFHPFIIGYRDQIYEFRSSKTELVPIPDKLVEAWCFDSVSDKKFELIHHFNHVSGRAEGQIYLLDGFVRQYSSIQLSRRVESASVHYQSDSYTLVIDKHQPASTIGQFVGEFSGLINGNQLKLQLSCRLGGLLDAQLWPSRLVVDQKVIDFSVLNSTHSVLALSETSIGKRYLQQANFISGNHRLLTPINPGGQGVWDYKLYSGESKLILREDSVLPGAFQLTSFDLNLLTRIKLSADLIDAQQAVMADYELTSDEQYVIYRDGSHETVMGDVEKWIRAVSVHGGSDPQQVNHSLPLWGDRDVHWFKWLPSSHKVLYLADREEDTSLADLFTANLDGSEVKKVSANIANGSVSTSPLNLVVVGDGRFVLYGVRQGNQPEMPLYVSATDGSHHIDTGIRAGLFSALPNSKGSTVYINAGSKGAHLLKIESGTVKKWPAPNFKKAQFSENDLYGIFNGELYAVRSINGVSQKICQSAGEVIGFQEFGHQDGLLVASYNQESKNLSLMRYQKTTEECDLLNTVPLQTSKLEATLAVADDQRHALVIVDMNGNHLEDLILVPLNGGAPIVVNTPTMVSARVKTAQFSSDSKGIIFEGNQISDENQIYFWALP